MSWDHRSKSLQQMRHKEFSKLNTKTEVIRPLSDEEYKKAGLDNLPSSTSWTKEETECLMNLCEKYDLRFLVVADRYADCLKDRYDQKQVKSLDLGQLAATALDPTTRKPIEEEERWKIRKRDLKTIRKYIYVNQLDK